MLLIDELKSCVIYGFEIDGGISGFWWDVGVVCGARAIEWTMAWTVTWTMI